jgi:branched-chain amino acid transport system substrate-binding protein
MWRFLVAAVAALIALSEPAEARRVALVIGNASYALGPLTNPENDADAIAKAFRDLGFDDVSLRKNLGGAAMRDAIRSFGARAAGAEVAEGIEHVQPISPPDRAEYKAFVAAMGAPDGTIFPFAALQYDAINVMACAMEKARSDAAAVFCKQIMSITNGPGKKVGV